MAHLSAQLPELVLLPAPVTLSEMSDCVGAVSYTVALVAKGTSSVAIFFPCDQRTDSKTQVNVAAAHTSAGQGSKIIHHDTITCYPAGTGVVAIGRAQGGGGERGGGAGRRQTKGRNGVYELVALSLKTGD